MDALDMVTIAIPCLNEERHIASTVQQALAQDYRADKLEVLVADGGSSDRTRSILEKIAERDPRLRIVDNPGRIQACGMNEIIRRARGEVIVRFDAHAEYTPGYVRACVRLLHEKGADNVGGAQRTLAHTPFQRALCAALHSPLGMGGAAYRRATEEGFVDTVWLGAYRRRVFETAGLYDPGAVTNEDAELNQRLLQQGGKIYLSPEVVAYHYPREGYRALGRQYFRYGSGRARTLLKHRRLETPRPLIPFGTVMLGSALLLLRSRWLWPAAAAYLLLTAAEATRVSRRHDADPLRTWATLPVMHVCHGVGFAVGLVRYGLPSSEWPVVDRLAVRTVGAAEGPRESRRAGSSCLG